MITSRNIEEASIRYYELDLELLFSRRPFVQSHGRQFTNIKPNRSDTINLAGDDPQTRVPLPKEFKTANLMIEIGAAGLTSSKPCYSNTMNVQILGAYGQVQVSDQDTGRPLSPVYVKAYARAKDGRIMFYKDGYTDPRGRFDYVSLNTNELENVERFSLLIMSEDHGAVVRETPPPTR